MNRYFSTAVAGLCVFSLAGSAYAQSASFSDMAPGDFGYEASVRMKQKGIMTGFDDGTFRPDLTVTRAEAIKMIVAPLIPGKELTIATETTFTDVPKDAWFAPYVAWAARKEIVSMPKEGGTFSPNKKVTRAEFLKMMFMAYGVDPNSYSEITLPLSPDVSNSKEWYYSYIRYGISSSVVMAPKGGLLTPNHELLRIEVAILLDRFLQYRAKERGQAMLNQARTEIETVLDALEKNDLKRAEYASIRSILYSRGAHATMPEDPTVKVAVKTSEAVRALVRAYKAGIDGKLDEVIKLANDASYIADQAKAISPSAATISTQIKSYANGFATSAKKQKR